MGEAKQNPKGTLRTHLGITGGALRAWLVAQAYDALAVGLLWLIGLLIARVPLAPIWAVLGALLQFIPYFGPLLALIGPAVAAAFTGEFEKLLYVLIVYGVIAVVDGFVLQPYFMRRTAKVPILVSILAPLLLGSILSFWGVLLSVPLLAVVYAYRGRGKRDLPEGAKRE